MKYLATAVLLAATPVSASGLADPMVTPEVVAMEAEESSGNVDTLIVAIWLATVLAAAGGAF